VAQVRHFAIKTQLVTIAFLKRIQRSSPHTIDVWMLGNVIYELYNGPFEQHSEIAGAPKAIPKVPLHSLSLPHTLLYFL